MKKPLRFIKARDGFEDLHEKIGLVDAGVIGVNLDIVLMRKIMLKTPVIIDAQANKRV